MNEENNQGNPSELGSSDDFFDAMDRDVNGAILEDQQVQENPQGNGPSMETREMPIGSNNNDVDWE